MRTRTEATAGVGADVDDAFLSTAPSRRRETKPTRMEAAAGVGANVDYAFSSTAPGRRREVSRTAELHPFTRLPTHTHTSSPPLLPPPFNPPPLPPSSLTTPALCTHLISYPPWPALYPRVSWRQVFLPGGHRGFTFTPHTQLHPLCTAFTPPLHALTRPLLTGSPQAETGTHVYCHGHGRRHRSRHDGAVAHPAQLPAASPRCRGLPVSSPADRVGKEPLGAAAERDVDYSPVPAHSSWASLDPPPPGPPIPPHPFSPPLPSPFSTPHPTPTYPPTPTPHSQHTHTHYTHTRSCLHARPSYARSLSLIQHLG